MNHAQFHIGLDFSCGDKRWRCTDVGSRVIVAISLDPHEVVSLIADPQDRSKRNERRYVTEDASWLSGPPYAIVEHVFDEDSIQGCRLDREDDNATKTLGELEALIKDNSFDIESYFKALHHFSKQPPFRTAPSRFEVFVDYCKTRPEGIDAGGENERTIQRAYAFVQFARTLPAAECLAQAWGAFPLAKVYALSPASDG